MVLLTSMACTPRERNNTCLEISYSPRLCSHKLSVLNVLAITNNVSIATLNIVLRYGNDTVIFGKIKRSVDVVRKTVRPNIIRKALRHSLRYPSIVSLQ
jgi:hypothetical protein